MNIKFLIISSIISILLKIVILSLITYDIIIKKKIKSVYLNQINLLKRDNDNLQAKITELQSRIKSMVNDNNQNIYIYDKLREITERLEVSDYRHHNIIQKLILQANKDQELQKRIYAALSNKFNNQEKMLEYLILKYHSTQLHNHEELTTEVGYIEKEIYAINSSIREQMDSIIKIIDKTQDSMLSRLND